MTTKLCVITTDGKVDFVDYQDDYKFLQKLVGGYIEHIPTKKFNVFVNEEGLMKGMSVNQAAGHVLQKLGCHLGHVVGPVVICNDYEEGLSEEEIKELQEIIG